MSAKLGPITLRLLRATSSSVEIQGLLRRLQPLLLLAQQLQRRLQPL